MFAVSVEQFFVFKRSVAHIQFDGFQRGIIDGDAIECGFIEHDFVENDSVEYPFGWFDASQRKPFQCERGRAGR